MGILRRFAVLIVSVIATVAICAVGAGTASASSTYRYLCTNQGECATAQGSGNYVEMEGATIPPHNDTNWYYPTGTAYTTIRQADTSLCMQLDHEASNRVIEAPCTTASYQEWDLTSLSQFRSEWDPALCLTSPFPSGPLYAGGCSTTPSSNQVFHALT